MDEEKKVVLKEVYDEIKSIQMALGVESVDIYRSHPKLWNKLIDLEEEIDATYANISHDALYDWKHKTLAIWHKIESSINAEIESMNADRNSEPKPWALCFLQDKRKPREICEVGFVTWAELESYFKKKVTVRDLQMKNLEKREYAGEQLVGPVGLSNDGTGKRRLKEVGIPALQKSVQFSPDAYELPVEEKTQPVKPDIIGIDLELDTGEEENLLELGDITVAWD